MDIWLTIYYTVQFLMKLRFPNGATVSIIILKILALLIKISMIITENDNYKINGMDSK